VSMEHTGPLHRGRRHLSPRLSPRAGAALALLGATGLVGVSTVASKAALDHTPPLTLGFARFALALIVLLVACRRAGVRPEFGRMPVLLGVTGVALPFACQNVGLQFTGAATATLIIEGAIPIATTLLGVWLLRERLTGRRLAGLVLALAGVVAVVSRGGAGDFSAAGSLLLLGTAISFSLYNVVGRRAFAGGVSLSVLTGSFVVGVLLLAPGAAFELATQGTGPITGEGSLLVLYLGLGGSALTQVLWAKGLVHLEAFEVAVAGTLMPIAGVATAAVVLGESIAAVQAVGIPLVMVGLFLSARADRRQRPPAARRALSIGAGRRLSGRPRLGNLRASTHDPDNPTEPLGA
jgi:drug/metabolite transporter (DMT)-like permease